MAPQTRALRQQAQQAFAQSLDQLGEAFDLGDDLFTELAQLPEAPLDQPLDATFPENSGETLGGDRAHDPTAQFTRPARERQG